MPETLVLRPIVYGQRTEIVTADGHGFTEVIRPGALTAVLASPGVDIACLRDHDAGRLLARTTSGTLRLTERPLGVEAILTTPDTELGAETVALVRRGDLAGGSFTFIVADERWYDDRQGGSVREIVSVARVRDVSICTFPQYDTTSVRLGNGSRSAQIRAMDAELDRHERSIADDMILHAPRLYGRRIARPSWARRGAVTRGCAHAA